MPTTISGANGVSQCDTDSVSTNDIQAAAVTAAKLSGGQSGSAPVYGCRAWCQFDGTLAGTNAPTAGGNVTNVTRNATGDYTINFTTALPSSSYAIVTGAYNTSGTNVNYVVKKLSGTQSTTALQIMSIAGDRTGGVDSNYISVAIFC